MSLTLIYDIMLYLIPSLDFGHQKHFFSTKLDDYNTPKKSIVVKSMRLIFITFACHPIASMCNRMHFSIFFCYFFRSPEGFKQKTSINIR